MDAVATLEAEVRELVRLRGIDPHRDTGAFAQLVDSAVSDLEGRLSREGRPGLVDPDAAARAVLDSVSGLGPLQVYLDDPEVEEVWINSPSSVFVGRGGTSELTTTILSAGDVRDLVERMLKPSGRRVDLSSPFVDATLADGSRLHVVIPDVSREHWLVNIRKHVVRADSLADLVELGTLTAPAAAFLRAAVTVGLNLLVSGATQSGKTTLDK